MFLTLITKIIFPSIPELRHYSCGVMCSKAQTFTLALVIQVDWQKATTRAEIRLYLTVISLNMYMYLWFIFNSPLAGDFTVYLCCCSIRHCLRVKQHRQHGSNICGRFVRSTKLRILLYINIYKIQMQPMIIKFIVYRHK